jgi:hypothetical protein
MVLAAPEFVIPELIQVLDEVEIAAKLEHRVLANGMVRGEEGAKLPLGLSRHIFEHRLISIKAQPEAERHYLKTELKKSF